jgi:hypothetical protein
MRVDVEGSQREVDPQDLSDPRQDACTKREDREPRAPQELCTTTDGVKMKLDGA